MNASTTTNERFLTLFHENKNRVYDYALRTLRDRDAAEDVAQEAFIRLFKTIRNSEVNNGRVWLFVTVRNLCYNYIRDHRKEVSLDRVDGSDLTVAPSANPEYLRLQKALDGMDAHHREALVLKEYQGFSYLEISQILNTTIPAVRAILYKARLQLKKNYEKIQTTR